MISITLKAKHHALIIHLMPDKSSTDALNYIIQAARGIRAQTVFNLEEELTVEVTEALVANLYNAIGAVPEQLVAADNRAIKEILLPQLYARPDVLQQIQIITLRNAEETENLRAQGLAYLQSLTSA